MNNKYIKKRCFAVLGYNYAGIGYVCGVFDNRIDAENYIQSQDDGWDYMIESTFYYQNNLPF